MAKCYLYPSCERDDREQREYGPVCVYFFLFIIRIPSPNGRDGTGVSVTGQEIHLALLFTITERVEEGKRKKEKEIITTSF